MTSLLRFPMVNHCRLVRVLLLFKDVEDYKGILNHLLGLSGASPHLTAGRGRVTNNINQHFTDFAREFSV